ncbi:hypothetical protein JCM3765_004535 [Sporobolomyces pararoseus]
MSTSHPTYDPAFSLLTSFSYYPNDPTRFNLSRHLTRLSQAHQTLSHLEPSCWCASTPPVASETISQAIQTVTSELRQDSRIRVTLQAPNGEPFVECFPLNPMPSYPVKLVLDNCATEYQGDPFMFVKTTNRTKYDNARQRKGATLRPSNSSESPPFDVILYNPKGEITETSISNIAFKFTRNPQDEVWITPNLSSGLLAGVKRAELLEKGEISEGVVTVERVLEAQKDGTLKMICFNGVRGAFEAFLEIE